MEVWLKCDYFVKYKRMKIDILTIFPDMFKGPFDESILRRAQDKLLVKIKIHNLRDWTEDKHKSVDGRPYGGGPGMILRVDVVDRAIKNIKSQTSNSKQIQNLKSQKTKVILLSAKGKKYNQQKVQEFSKLDHLILVCGHYEGVDQRIADYLVDEVVSVGDYVLTGGELPAMVVVDSVVRLLPGVLGDKSSLKEESHTKPGYVEYPQYTRPEEYKDWKVPEILLSGNHAEIEKWRQEKAKKK